MHYGIHVSLVRTLGFILFDLGLCSVSQAHQINGGEYLHRLKLDQWVSKKHRLSRVRIDEMRAYRWRKAASALYYILYNYIILHHTLSFGDCNNVIEGFGGLRRLRC